MFRLIMTLALGALTLVAISITTNAMEATLLADKHWSNVEEIDPILATNVCRAFTATSDLAQGLELSMSYPKDGKMLPIITLRSPVTAPIISVKISSRESVPMFLLKAAALEGGNNVYWYAPINFEALERFIRAKDRLEIFFDPAGTPVPAKISLSGSANALEAVRKCLKPTIRPDVFFKALNQEKDALTPDLGDRSAAFLQKATQDAYAAFLAGSSLEAELATLRKPFGSHLRKEEAAQKYLNERATKSARASEKLDAARAKVATIEQDLGAAKADLAELKIKKPQAEADLAQKKAIYLPLKEKMVPQEKRVSEAKSSVRRAEGAIDQAEGVISRGQRAIRALENERAQLQSAIPGLQNEVSRLQREYDDADSEFRRYDTRRERERFLDNDSSYRSAKSDLSRKESDLRSAESDYYRAQSWVRSAEAALNHCRVQPNPQCSSQESELNSARSEESQASSKMQSLRWEISSLESRIRSAESDADRKANDEENRLRRIRDDYDSQLGHKRGQLNYANSRIAEIRAEVPRLRRQVDQAQNSLPGLRDRLKAAEAELAQTIAERDEFARGIGFDVAVKNYEEAVATLESINKRIASRSKEIPSLEKSLASAQRDVPRAEKELTRAQAEQTKAAAALAAISEQLKPLREQEAGLVARVREQREKFALNRAVYQDLYKELAGQR